MNTEPMGLLSNEDLDAVVGGMMNNGQGQFLQTQPKNGGPPNGTNLAPAEAFMAGALLLAIVF